MEKFLKSTLGRILLLILFLAILYIGINQMQSSAFFSMVLAYLSFSTSVIILLVLKNPKVKADSVEKSFGMMFIILLFSAIITYYTGLIINKPMLLVSTSLVFDFIISALLSAIFILEKKKSKRTFTRKTLL